MKILGIVLLIVGVLGAAYGGFSYTKETHEAKIGPVSLEVKEEEHVSVPLWAGIAVAALGAFLVFKGPSGVRT